MSLIDIENKKNFKTLEQFNEALTNLELKLAENLSTDEMKKFSNIKTETVKLIERKNNTNVQYLKTILMTPDYANEELLVTQLNSDLKINLDNDADYVRITLFVLMDCIDLIDKGSNEEKRTTLKSVNDIISNTNVGFKPPKQEKKKQRVVTTTAKYGVEPNEIPFIFLPNMKNQRKYGGKRRKTKKPKKRSRKTRKC